jgi:hypothetical protein
MRIVSAHRTRRQLVHRYISLVRTRVRLSVRVSDSCRQMPATPGICACSGFRSSGLKGGLA